MDFNVFLFSKSISVILFFAVWVFSLVAFIVFSWLLDSIWVFKTWKLAREFSSSFHTYFTVFLVVATLLLIDVAFVVLEREFNPQLHTLFRSLTQKKGLREEDRETMFQRLVGAFNREQGGVILEE